DPNGDADQDGMSNLGEHTADTNPTKASSNLKIIASQTSSNGIRMTWVGGTQARQYLQRNTAVGGTNAWINVLTNQPPTVLTNSFLDSKTNRALFYRIKVER